MCANDLLKTDSKDSQMHFILCSLSKKSSSYWAFLHKYGIIEAVMKVIVKGRENRDQLEVFSIEEFVPADHLLRKIDSAVDFSQIYDIVEDLYCADNSRPILTSKSLYISGFSCAFKSVSESTILNCSCEPWVFKYPRINADIFLGSMPLFIFTLTDVPPKNLEGSQ